MFCKDRNWRQLYSQGHDLWCADAYSHPAKMSPALAFRIIEHLQELGVLKRNSVILDPMAGVGTTNICAALKGYKTLSIELEGKFVELQKKNREYVERKTYRKLDWGIIQGDARNLSEILASRENVGVMSPPFGPNLTGGHALEQEMRPNRSYRLDESYSDNPANIGNLKDVVGITSPPYASDATSGGGIDWEKAGRPDRLKPSEARHNVQGLNPEGYGSGPENIGNLPDPLIGITSPPFEDSLARRDFSYEQAKRMVMAMYTKHGRSFSEADMEYQINLLLKRASRDYVGSEGQIGQEQGETYLSAMLQVYQGCCKVCSHLVVVIKDPTRDGKIRRLGRDTCKLLRLAGFEIFDYHQAILFEEQELAGLFGKHKRVKGRLSFFKRLGWQKGQPISNFEHVIFARRGDELAT